MFKRKIYKEMADWKESLSSKKKALTITGSRQIGKTTIVKQFASDNYDNVVYLNFFDDKIYRKVFEGDNNVDRIISALSASGNFNFVPYKTVIIFDEIQECADARSAIKVFCLDGRYDIITTGSLLGITGYSKKTGSSVPVGFEHFVRMYPMDFEEYLWAIGVETQTIDYLKERLLDLKPIEQGIHEIMSNHFKNYICVGGMPEAINKYIETKDFIKIRLVQHDIISAYKADFGKHLNKQENSYVNNSELIKINEVFESIPQQLAADNSKFKFKDIEKNKKFRDYEQAIRWLQEAGIISVCYNISNVEFPLEAYKIRNWFKIYVQDTGLFLSMLDKSMTKSILTNQLGMYKGYIYENIIADAFTKNGINLFYYNNKIEIDFLTQYNMKVVPIEVKANDGNSKSLKTLVDNNKDSILFSIKIKNTNIGFVNNILTIPHYLSFLIKDDFVEEMIEKNHIGQ